MKTSKRKQALVAGISLIIMAVAAMLAYGYVFPQIFMEGDPLATWDGLTDNRILFFTGLGGWLIIFITDLLVTVSLFYFFRDTRKYLSMATAAVRFVYTMILGIALISLFKIIPLLNMNDIDATQAGSRTLEAIEAFQATWSFGLIIFGLHLLGLGILGIFHNRIPKIYGYLLLLAGLGYLVVHISRALSGIPADTVDLIESILMLPMALGEILLAIWLVIKGGRTKNEIAS